VPPAAAYR